MGRGARLVVVLLTAAAVLAAAAVCAIAVRPGLYRIASESMDPLLPVGTIVVTSGAAAPVTHRPVTFVADGRVVTHILVGYAADGSLITRGTANRADDRWDAPVYPRDVRGRVLFGVLIFAPSFWASPRASLLLAGCCAVLLFIVLRRTSAGDRLHDRATMEI